MARWQLAVDRVLSARRPTLRELLSALDEVNPTPHRLDPDEQVARYEAKARIQTRLIELYPHDLELRIDGEGWVLGLRGGRDAKHVVRTQLGEGAQDWFSSELLRLDVAEDTPSPRPELAPAVKRSSELLDEIEARMSDGDYEGAVTLLLPRAAMGDARAALQMFELLVDYLDQPQRVIEHAKQLPRTVLQASAASHYGLALVRCGQLEEAERVLRASEDPSSAAGWEELARVYLARRDAAGARRSAERIEAVDRTRVAAVDAIRQQAAAILTAALASELEQMQAAIEAQRWDDAERLAQSILARDPHNRQSRAALAVVEDARAVAASERALQEGERLWSVGRFWEAAGTWRSADRHPEAKARAAEAEVHARAEERERAVQLGLEALRRDLPALAAYARTDDDIRAAVRARASAELQPVLDWIESCPAGRPEQRAQMALAAVRASEHLAAGRAEEALAVLEPHVELAGKSRPLRELLRACREQLAQRECQRATALLAEAEASEEGALEEARRALALVPVRALGEASRERHAALASRIAERAAEEGLLRDFERLFNDDPIDALRLARRVAHTKGAAWFERAERAQASVRRTLRAHDLQLAEPSCDLAPPSHWTLPHVGLDLASGSLWMAEPCGRWLALAQIPIGEPRVRRGILLRGVHRLPSGGLYLLGPGSAWVMGLSRALKMNLDLGLPIESLHTEEGVRLLSSVPVRGGVWCRGRGNDRWAFWPDAEPPTQRQGDLRGVVPLTGAGEAVGQTRDGELFRLAASVPRSYLGTAEGELLAATVHPTEPGRVVVTLEIERSHTRVFSLVNGQKTLLAERTVVPPTRTREIVAAASRQTGLVYLLEPAPDGHMRLSALAADGSVRFSVAIASRAALAMDPEGIAAAIVVQGADGLHVCLLAAEAPELPKLLQRHPESPEGDGCGLEYPDDLQTLVEQLEWDDGTLDERIEILLAVQPGDPAYALRVVTAVLQTWWERGTALAQRLGIDVRSDVTLALPVAEGLAGERRHPEIEQLLSSLDPSPLLPSQRRHFWHLRAEAALLDGRTDDARRYAHMGLLERASARVQPSGLGRESGEIESGDCPLEGCLAWAELIERSDPGAPRPSTGDAASWWDIRSAIAEANGRLAQGEARIRLDEGAVAWATEPEIVFARGKAVLADSAMPLWGRLRALARCDGPAGHSALIPGLVSVEEQDRIESEATAELSSPTAEPGR